MSSQTKVRKQGDNRGSVHKGFYPSLSTTYNSTANLRPVTNAMKVQQYNEQTVLSYTKCQQRYSYFLCFQCIPCT